MAKPAIVALAKPLLFGFSIPFNLYAMVVYPPSEAVCHNGVASFVVCGCCQQNAAVSLAGHDLPAFFSSAASDLPRSSLTASASVLILLANRNSLIRSRSSGVMFIISLGGFSF